MEKKWWILIIIISIIILSSILFALVRIFLPLFLVFQTYDDYKEIYNETDGSRVYEDYT